MANEKQVNKDKEIARNQNFTTLLMMHSTLCDMYCRSYKVKIIIAKFHIKISVNFCIFNFALLISPNLKGCSLLGYPLSKSFTNSDLRHFLNSHSYEKTKENRKNIK